MEWLRSKVQCDLVVKNVLSIGERVYAFGPWVSMVAAVVLPPRSVVTASHSISSSVPPEGDEPVEVMPE